jgi:hypothetical protein
MVPFTYWLYSCRVLLLRYQFNKGDLKLRKENPIIINWKQKQKLKTANALGNDMDKNGSQIINEE